MSGNGNGEKSTATHDRLIEAAGEVFAAKGFHKATVREIVAQAGANLNAINYHFGDKERLYQAVLEHGQVSLNEDTDLIPARDTTLDPAERLRAFIRAFLLRALAKDAPTHRAKLLAREMTEPTNAMNLVISRYFRPRFELLVEIVRRIADPGLTQHERHLCAISIVGQCVHLVHARSVVMRVLPELSYSEEDIDRLAEHVLRFSLAALRNITAEHGEDS